MVYKNVNKVLLVLNVFAVTNLCVCSVFNVCVCVHARVENNPSCVCIGTTINTSWLKH